MDNAVSGYLDWNDLWDSIADIDLGVYYLQNQLEQRGKNECFFG